MNLKILLTLLLALFAMGACSDDDSKCKTKELSILSVETTTKADLSLRQDWKLLVKDIEYTASFNGNLISALPKSETETYRRTQYYDCPDIGYIGGCIMPEPTYCFSLVSPAYLLADLVPISWNYASSFLLDQGSEEKLLATDILAAILKDDVPNVKDVKLVYMFHKFEFSFADLPQNASVKLCVLNYNTEDGDEIIPLVVDGVYKFLGFHHYSAMAIEVKVGENTHILKLSNLQSEGFQSIYHTFTIRYNKDATDLTKVLTIENHKAEDRNK